MINHAQHQYCENGADGAQRNQTEGVVGRVAVATDGRNTDTQRHNKRDRHRSGGDAAGVKGYGTKIFRNKQHQYKGQHIKRHQHPVQRNTEQHTQQSAYQKQANAQRNGIDQHRIGHRRHLLRQHLQVRLGNGDDKAQHKAQQYNDPKLFGLGHPCAYLFAHGCHRHFRTQRKEHHSHNDQQCAQQKAKQDAGSQRSDGKTESQHDGNNRQNRRDRFF